MREGKKNWKDRIDKRCSTFSSNLQGEMKRVEKRGSQLLIQRFSFYCNTIPFSQVYCARPRRGVIGRHQVGLHQVGSNQGLIQYPPELFSNTKLSLQITATVVETNGTMHSGEGETRELAVADLERAVAHLQLQRIEKGGAR